MPSGVSHASLFAQPAACAVAKSANATLEKFGTWLMSSTNPGLRVHATKSDRATFHRLTASASWTCDQRLPDLRWLCQPLLPAATSGFRRKDSAMIPRAGRSRNAASSSMNGGDPLRNGRGSAGVGAYAWAGLPPFIVTTAISPVGTSSSGLMQAGTRPVRRGRQRFTHALERRGETHRRQRFDGTTVGIAGTIGAQRRARARPSDR